VYSAFQERLRVLMADKAHGVSDDEDEAVEHFRPTRLQPPRPPAAPAPARDPDAPLDAADMALTFRHIAKETL
jgi:hypothetical protein